MESKMTIEKFKKKYDEAVKKVLKNPVSGLKGEEEIDTNTQLMMMLSGVLLFEQLKKELFREEQ